MTSDVEESEAPPSKIQSVLLIAGWGLEALGIALLYPTVLRWMWTWFIVPLGVPTIGHWHAAGVIMLVTWLQFLFHHIEHVPSSHQSPFAGSQRVGMTIGRLAAATIMLLGGHAAHSMMVGP